MRHVYRHIFVVLFARGVSLDARAARATRALHLSGHGVGTSGRWHHMTAGYLNNE
jgi:hypothetical protein